MSKKTNTILFILGGTVFNILVTIICFLVFLLIFGSLNNILPENSIVWILPIIFVLAIISAFAIYHVTLKFIMKKVDMDKYFDPIFRPRRPPVRKP